MNILICQDPPTLKKNKFNFVRIVCKGSMFEPKFIRFQQIMMRKIDKKKVRFGQVLEEKSYNDVKVGLKQGSKLD
jgi:hypothetical protein